jgi:prepilin-type N-terminal cleavage/methylation domain-containing protein
VTEKSILPTEGFLQQLQPRKRQGHGSALFARRLITGKAVRNRRRRDCRAEAAHADEIGSESTLRTMLELNHSAAKKPVTVAVLTMRTITTNKRLNRHVCECLRHSHPSLGETRLRRGFTLIELVIVIMIISVLAGAAIPTFFDSLLFHQVESAARRVKSDLELARRTARQTSSGRSITFSGGTYTLDAIKSLDNPHDEYEVDLLAAPFHLERVTADFEGEPRVSFNGYGAPTRGGRVELECKSLKCIVMLDAVTGEVTIDSSHSDGRTAKVAAAAETN